MNTNTSQQANGSQRVVIFIAPPGAGKGTQADLLQEKRGFVHLESSKVIEEKFATAKPDDTVLQEEIKKNRAGILNDPTLVTEWMSDAIRKLHADGKSIVLSGSPRTLYEAEHLVPLWEDLYGRDNMLVFFIKITDEESIRRNSHRRMCKANRHPIPNFPEYKDITACPQDGSEIFTREDDQPERIKVRHQQFHERTAPVLEYLTAHRFDIREINGERGIEQVTEDILKHIPE